MNGKSLHAALELFAARKREIVGIARVFGSCRPRQSAQAAIHPIGANIRERGRRGRALRQMRACMEQSGFLKLSCIGVGRGTIPNPARNCIGANASQQIRYRFGISNRSKNSLHPRARDRWKEILQIHFQNSAPANVRRDKGLDGAAFDEAVRSRMRRDFVENVPPGLAAAALSAVAWALQSSGWRPMFSPKRDSDNAPAARSCFCRAAPLDRRTKAVRQA